MAQSFDPDLLDDAPRRLEEADRAGDAARLELLESLYETLSRELDAEQAAPAGR